MSCKWVVDKKGGLDRGGMKDEVNDPNNARLVLYLLCDLFLLQCTYHQNDRTMSPGRESRTELARFPLNDH